MCMRFRRGMSQFVARSISILEKLGLPCKSKVSASNIEPILSWPVSLRPRVRFVTAKSGPERATKTRQYDLLRLRVGQKNTPRTGSMVCYGQEWARKSHHDASTICYSQAWARKSRRVVGVRFATAKSGPERATKTGPYDLLRQRVGQKEPPRPGNTICSVSGRRVTRKGRRAQLRPALNISGFRD